MKDDSSNDAILAESTEIAPVSHTISHRRTIGAFYTPITVSTALSNWGIRSKEDRVLEPCFGGCTFLEAAIERLKSFGHTRPEMNLFGCDLDPLAFQYLKTRVATDGLKSNFFLQDFMSFEFENLNQKEKFDLVIGNPPYIGHGKFGKSQREILDAWRKLHGITIDRRASLWAYFVIHALHFLKPGGRIAWVLPGSFLHAKYATSIREALHAAFSNVAAITIAERLFISEGTEETTVVLLADGYKRPPQREYISVTCVDSVDDFVNLLKTDDQTNTQPEQIYPGHGMVPHEAGEAHFAISEGDSIIDLGDIATLQIGLVTGNTKFFVKSKSDWKTEDVEARHLQYILPQSKWVSGINLTSVDTEIQISNDVPCLALNSPASPRAERLVRYLQSYDADLILKNATFGKRPHWFRFADDKIPDAFFVFMASLGPRIILNSVSCNATNSVYRVFFKDDVSLSMQKLAAISIHSTFSQLSAEIVGHARGSGALKLEPSSAHKIRLSMPDNLSENTINTAFNAVDAALRKRSWEEARKLADRLLFGNDTEKLALLDRGLLTVRNRRMRK
ncbi:N-6 DNA Methylase [Duganella sacchari]|uniref:site-specific DNA-methyltransferase (adenine-specific) n=1 Tax=Duganella sacchari TaxID=551987 RepID=A0A1M7REP7_9BURK|nr:N-6 DNA methylase [Duganella sacchari]SHN44753.1 N-6 DNA Methylase [Duganella sacchari]